MNNLHTNIRLDHTYIIILYRVKDEIIIDIEIGVVKFSKG